MALSGELVIDSHQREFSSAPPLVVDKIIAPHLIGIARIAALFVNLYPGEDEAFYGAAPDAAHLSTGDATA